MKNLFLFDGIEKPEKQAEDAAPAVCPPPRIGDFDLGITRGEFECFRCCGNSFDIMQYDRGHIMIWCWLCGARQWEKAPARDEFVFDGGRYGGLRLDQVAAQEGGVEYIKFMAAKSKLKATREKCQQWLDSRGGHL